MQLRAHHHYSSGCVHEVGAPGSLASRSGQVDQSVHSPDTWRAEISDLELILGAQVVHYGEATEDHAAASDRR